MTKVGLISDTHDHLAPEALEALEGCQYILHAGDLTHPKILLELEEIAPVTMVRGNCDWGFWAEEYPGQETITIEGVQIQIIHNVDYLQLDERTQIVVYGHTHRARQHFGGDVLYINPGSASEPRGGEDPSVAILTIDGSKYSIEEKSWDALRFRW